MVSALINPAVVARPGGFGRSDEYIFFVFVGDAAPKRLRLDENGFPAKVELTRAKFVGTFFVVQGQTQKEAIRQVASIQST